MFFDGFTLEYAELRGQRIRLRRGGEGPPLLLLHGNPQTHAMWHKLAPLLARRFTCYLPDIRGYGFSSKPPVQPGSAPHAKREHAADLLALMRHHGHESFRVVSHDRGARGSQASPALRQLCLVLRPHDGWMGGRIKASRCRCSFAPSTASSARRCL